MDFRKELLNGKFIRISKPGFTPTVFWLSNWGETVNYFNRAAGGAFEHPDNLEAILQHFDNMIRDGFTLTIVDIEKAGA